MATEAEIERAKKDLQFAQSEAGNLGQKIEANPEFRENFYGMTLAQLESGSRPDNVSLTDYIKASGKKLFILSETKSRLQKAMDDAAAAGTRIFINGAPATSAETALAGITLTGLHTINLGPDPAYIQKLQGIIDSGNTPAQALAPTPAAAIATRPVIIPSSAARAEPDPRTAAVRPTTFTPATIPVNSPAALPIRAPEAVVVGTPTGTPVTQPIGTPTAARVMQTNEIFAMHRSDAGATTVGVQYNQTVDVRATGTPTARTPLASQTPARGTPSAAPFTMGRITPQTTVLDLIVNGIQTSTEAEPAALRTAATEKLTEELKKSKPELANNPQALNAAVQQGLPNSIRGLILDLSKDKAIQQKIATGFLDGMRRESPSAENSSFYKHLKTLSSDERTFGAFLNTNMLDGITRDYEARARSENGGTVPNRVIDAVAANIMRVRPEIQQYNDRVGQNITDFVRNPEISRQRVLHSPSTQREIRDGVAKFRREHPFQTFFADLIGTNMHAEGEKRALAEMTKRGLRDKNYAREIQSGFIDELNKRTAQELRGEQLENVRAFTRHLSQLPYSRFIQEDISPRRVSSIILGIERPGEERAPSRHLIPQHIASRPVPHVNMAATEPHRATQQQQQMPPRPAAPNSAV